jgi:hypothetical protein
VNDRGALGEKLSTDGSGKGGGDGGEEDEDDDDDEANIPVL